MSDVMEALLQMPLVDDRLESVRRKIWSPSTLNLNQGPSDTQYIAHRLFEDVAVRRRFDVSRHQRELGQNRGQ